MEQLQKESKLQDRQLVVSKLMYQLQYEDNQQTPVGNKKHAYRGGKGCPCIPLLRARQCHSTMTRPGDARESKSDDLGNKGSQYMNSRKNQSSVISLAIESKHKQVIDPAMQDNQLLIIMLLSSLNC